MPKRVSDRLELQTRIRAVQEWILQDYLTCDIIANCVKTWGITERQAYRYLWAANRFFAEKDKLSLEQKRAYYLAKKKKLLRDMKPEEKKSAAGVVAVNRVLDSMAKLEGVTVDTLKLIGDPNQPVKTQTTVEFSSPIDYSKLSTEFLDMIIANRKAHV
jgi:hypothetical protein